MFSNSHLKSLFASGSFKSEVLGFLTLVGEKRIKTTLSAFIFIENLVLMENSKKYKKVLKTRINYNFVCFFYK